MQSYSFRWDVIPRNFGFLVDGIQMTLFLSVVTLIVATALGLLIALMQMSRFRTARIAALTVGEIIRNTPILVQLLWVYYVLPIVFNVQIDALSASILGLSLYSAVFISEVFRAGIATVPIGHREAAQVLGLTPVQSFVRIVGPQAIRSVLPPLAANFVQLIKYSSLASVISVSEVTRRGMELSSSTFRPLEIFTFIGVIWEARLARR
jgi:polar amino acid transport system permease protein